MALQEVCSGNHVIKESRLINELHKAVKHMYDEHLVPHLVSCLTDTIRTALHRMVDLKMAEIKNYSTEHSSSISFISSNFDQMKNLEEATQCFIEVQAYSDQEMEQIHQIVEEAVNASLVTHLTARL